MLIFKNKIEEIAIKYDIQFLIYFGSYGTEFFNADSDVDIAYLASRILSIEERMSFLEDIIHYHRKAEIDLVDLLTADSILRREVAINGRVFYEAEEGLFLRYSLYYIKMFYELSHVYQAEMRKLGDEIRELSANG